MQGKGLTVHGLSLDDIVAIIFGEEELEVGFWVLNASNFIFVSDEVAMFVSMRRS